MSEPTTDEKQAAILAHARRFYSNDDDFRSAIDTAVHIARHSGGPPFALTAIDAASVALLGPYLDKHQDQPTTASDPGPKPPYRLERRQFDGAIHPQHTETRTLANDTIRLVLTVEGDPLNWSTTDHAEVVAILARFRNQDPYADRQHRQNRIPPLMPDVEPRIVGFESTRPLHSMVVVNDLVAPVAGETIFAGRVADGSAADVLPTGWLRIR